MNQAARLLLEVTQEVSGIVLIVAGFGLWYWIDERRNRKRSNR